MSVLLQMTLLLGTALILVPLLRLPQILGFFVAGLVAGFYVTPPDLLLNLSIILIMLMMGLQFKAPSFWRSSLLYTGLLGSLLTLLVWGLTNCNFLESFLVGFALSTPSYFLSQNTCTVGLMVSLALLSLLPVISETQFIHHGIASLAIMTTCLSGLFLLSHFIFVPFLQKFNTPYMQLGLSIFIVLLSLVVTTTFNLNPAIGALFAGLTLAQTQQHTHILNYLTPLQPYMLGLFFMMVGILLPFDVWLNSPLTIIVGTIILVGLKAGLSYAFSHFNKQKFNIQQAQSGELSIILLLAAQNEYLVSQISVYLWMMMLSMLITPLLAGIKKPHIHSEKPDIMIVGFGRFGQTIGQKLASQQISFSVVDRKFIQSDTLNPIHFYHGNAVNTQTLIDAGIEHIHTLILSIDDIEDTLNIARYLTLYHPKIQLLVRAYDSHQVTLLKGLGIQTIWQETQASALCLTEYLLEHTQQAKANL